MKKQVKSKSNSFFSSENLNSPILMWTLILIGVIFILKQVSNQEIIPSNRLTPILFVVALIYWIIFALSAVSVHPNAAKSVARINSIVSKGIYSRVRHPIYSAYIVLVVGIFFLWPRLNVFLSAVWAIAILITWMRFEEAGLSKKFGKKYESYKKRVPMIIPNYRQMPQS